MKFPQLLAIMALCVGLCANGYGQLPTTNVPVNQLVTWVNVTQALKVCTNQVLEIHGYTLQPQAANMIQLALEETNIALVAASPAGPGSSATPFIGNNPIRLVGPASVNFYLANGGWCTFRVVDATSTPTPSTSVVIPTDATGPVQIVMESSQDLVNWVGASPATYGANTTNRFFRVRAIRQ